MLTSLLLPWVMAALILAMVLAAVRLLRGPDVLDRILALDTLYVLAMALLVLLEIRFGNGWYFEAALLIALLGFVSTLAAARLAARGRVIE
jgi:multicomponent K+:H+ antiporter subunit F